MEVKLPTDDVSSAACRKSLHRLAEMLNRSGYGEFCASFDPLRPRPESWVRRRDNAVDRLRPLIDLFLLGRRVPVSEIDPDITDHFPLLEPLGVLGVDDQGFSHLNGLVLFRAFGLWLLSERPSPNPRVHYGDDSVALLTRLAPSPGGTTLDLCSGLGVQALYCARTSAGRCRRDRPGRRCNRHGQ